MLVDFDNIWKNHPGGHAKPCNFDNQCAIRMGEALRLSKVDLSTFRGVRCWFGHEHPHILRAQELANWMKNNPAMFGKCEEYDKTHGLDFFRNKKGIVFFQNGWGATDHVDVWNGQLMKAGSPEYFDKKINIWFWAF